MPGNVHVVPFDDSDSGNKRKHRSNQGYDGLVYVVEGAFRDPQEQDDHEYSHSPPLLCAHLAHGVELNLQTLYSSLYLRMLLLLFHREEYVHSHEQADDQDNHTHWPHGYQPIGVTEVT